jgi:hypothetical protein
MGAISTLSGKLCYVQGRRKRKTCAQYYSEADPKEFALNIRILASLLFNSSFLSVLQQLVVLGRIKDCMLTVMSCVDLLKRQF